MCSARARHPHTPNATSCEASWRGVPAVLSCSCSKSWGGMALTAFGFVFAVRNSAPRASPPVLSSATTPAQTRLARLRRLRQHLGANRARCRHQHEHRSIPKDPAAPPRQLTTARARTAQRRAHTALLCCVTLLCLSHSASGVFCVRRVWVPARTLANPIAR